MKTFSFLLFFFFILSAHADDALQVGIATKDVTPAVDDQIPLGGYGSIERRNWPFHLYHYPFFRTFRIAEGKLDAIRAKAMFVKRGEKQLLFVGLDVIGVTKDLHQDLVERLKVLGFSPETIFISGTHTHSGPGALSKNPLWEVIGMDTFQKKFYEKYLSQIVETVTEAVNKAQAAELYTLSYDTKGLVYNRRGLDRPFSNRANLLLAKSTAGEWMGGMINFAVHGTSLKEQNLFFSADVPGAIEREMEKLAGEFNGYFRPLSKPEFIFINGAEGDIAPDKDYLELGAEFARQTAAVWDNSQPLVADWTVKQQEIDLGKPRVDLAKCVKAKWMPKHVNLGLKKYLSPLTLISQLHFGPLWMLSWPGEATNELGQRLIAQAHEAGAEDAWVLGLTNDHLAYFVTPGEFETGGFESCSTFFGAEGGESVLSAHKALSNKMSNF